MSLKNADVLWTRDLTIIDVLKSGLLGCLLSFVFLSPVIADDRRETDTLGQRLERSQLPDLPARKDHDLHDDKLEERAPLRSLEIDKYSNKSSDDKKLSELNRPSGSSHVLRKALKAYRDKRITVAISGFELAAENNSLIARFLLAHIYRTGKSGVVNHRRAFDYYQQITTEFADSDIQYSRHAPYVAHAFVQLARYMEGGVEALEIKANPVLARILFEKAAHFGDVEGQYQLGRFLIETGKRRNVKLGQRWLTRAAMKNNGKAQAYLGALYWQGDLVPRKQSLALAWIEFARRNATGSVKHQIERLYEAVQFDMTLQEKRRAKSYIEQLKTKYNVVWRQNPMSVEEEDELLLDGIIYANPPEGLAKHQYEGQGPFNQHTETTPGWDPKRDGDYSSSLPDGRSLFGYQFDYGNAGQ